MSPGPPPARSWARFRVKGRPRRRHQPRRNFVNGGTVHNRLFVGLSALALLLAMPPQSLFGQRNAAANAPAGPTPRTADGRVIWGALPGHKGVWNAAGSTLWDVDKLDPDNPNNAFFSFNSGKLKLSQVPRQPWARALLNTRMVELDEPYTRCKPSGGARN